MNEHTTIHEPFTLTIFGASGDLASLKVFPAIFALVEQKRFAADYCIIGYARTALNQEEFRNKFSESVRKNYKEEWGDYQEKILQECLSHIHYFSGQYDNVDDFSAYEKVKKDLCNTKKHTQLLYFSVPPSTYGTIAENIAKTAEDLASVRLIIEKPFGEDEVSARKLFHRLTEYFREDQLYLLDHYLGKKPVQSIVAMRHSNRILNTMLRGDEVANLQISALESLGVGNRVGYYNASGTLKDMVQSHLLQLLALLAMSIPVRNTADNIRREKASVLQAVEFIPGPDSLCIGQYNEYRGEHESVQDSNTPTFIAVKLHINRERWHNVPILLRTGKRLFERHTYMSAELKKFSFQSPDDQPNRIVIEFSPNEQISIDLVNELGESSRATPINASHSLSCTGDSCLPEHGLLLLDVLRSEKKFFLSIEEILACWRIVDQIQAYIDTKEVALEFYASGSSGPEGQQRLVEGSVQYWFDPHV